MAAAAGPGLSAERALLAAIAATSAALLMTELALTRIFSVTMFYHFAYLAISIALFGLSASGVFVYVARGRLAARATAELLCLGALLHAAAALVALGLLVRVRLSLDNTPGNLARIVAIYALGALPFFTGGAVLALAFSRLTERINTLYAADLIGAAAGCVILVPMLNELGAPGVVISAAALSTAASIGFAPAHWRVRSTAAGLAILGAALWLQFSGMAPFDAVSKMSHGEERLLFSKWNSFSRIGVYDHSHSDWALSPKFAGPLPPSLLMDIDASAATTILRGSGKASDGAHLRYDMSALAYHLVERDGGFSALVIGPGGGRDLLAALSFGARAVDGVEINPIIVNDVMLDKFREYSGGVYANPRVAVHVEDGRSFVRRSPQRFDIIQASLVDTWAATAAGAFTLTENSLYTTEAFLDYLDHLSADGVLTFTRWVPDGLRLVTLAQDACARRGLDPREHIALAEYQGAVTFMLKRSPLSRDEVARLRRVTRELGFTLVYAPGAPAPARPRERVDDFRDLILAADRGEFLAAYPQDVRATTDDRPFFFHTTHLRDQLHVALGGETHLGSGLSALLMAFAASVVLVLAFIVAPLRLAAQLPTRGWGPWLAYFGALGTGFMLLEVALLQRFVLLLGHPVYSLTVTLFSLLLGTGLGSFISGAVRAERVGRFTVRALLVASAAAALAAFALAGFVDSIIAWPLAARIAAAAAVLIPLGIVLGTALPGGMRLLHRANSDIVAWAWGMNGAFSVIGATLAIFVAMNWGFTATSLLAALVYLSAAAILHARARG